MTVHLTYKNFFTEFYIIHPYSKSLAESDRKTALIASIILGLLTVGIVHATCAIVERCIRKKDAKDNTTIGKTKHTGDASLGTQKPKSIDNIPPADLEHYRGDKKVEVAMLGGRKLTIEYGDGATILHIKHFIREQTNKNISEMRIVFAGKEYINDSDMKSLNLVPDSRIHLVMKLPK